MQKIITLFLVIACLGNALTVDDFPVFDDYITTYNKTYNATQLIKREAQYALRLQIMIGITDYTPKVNNFSDWYDSEIEVLKGLKTPGTNSSDTPPSETASRPASVDWTTTAVTTPKNQGYCGSCWAFATAGYAESKLIIDDRYDTDIDLSEQVLLECTTGSSCNGGYLQYSFERLLEGLPIEEVYSYSPNDLYGEPICEFFTIAVGKIDQNYYDLSDGELEELVAERPIAISLSADGWQNYGSGTFKCGINDPINHAVLLVGYTSDYWLIKNSWGTNWGEGGYIKVSKNPLYNCGIGNSAHRTFEVYNNGIAVVLLLIIGILFQ